MTWMHQMGVLKHIASLLCMVEAIIQCILGSLSVYSYWESQEVGSSRLRNSGWLVLSFGAIQLLACGINCFKLTIERRMYKCILTVFALWSMWVIGFDIYQWSAIHDYTKGWSDVVIISMCLMVTYFILVIGQCFIYVHIICVLPRKKMPVHDFLPLATDAD